MLARFEEPSFIGSCQLPRQLDVDGAVIDIANQFTRFPAGRYREDGPFSGQRFREDFLMPALQRGGTVRVLLDGTMGFGSSFLEEAFAGLVRAAGLDPDDLKDRLELVSRHQSVIDEIFGYIADTRH